MNILDENILKDQRELLQSWRVRMYQIGHDAGRQGMKDSEIIPLLHQMRDTTIEPSIRWPDEIRKQG